MANFSEYLTLILLQNAKLNAYYLSYLHNYNQNYFSGSDCLILRLKSYKLALVLYIYISGREFHNCR